MGAFLIVGAALAMALPAIADENSNCVAAMNAMLPPGSPVTIGVDGRMISKPAAKAGRVVKTSNIGSSLGETGAELEYTDPPSDKFDTAHTYKILIEQPLRSVPDSWAGPFHFSMSKDGDTYEYYTKSPNRLGCEITKVVRTLKGQTDRNIVYEQKFCEKVTALNAGHAKSAKPFSAALNELNKDPQSGSAKFGYFEAPKLHLRPIELDENATPYFRPVSADHDANTAWITAIQDRCKLEAHELKTNSNAKPMTNPSLGYPTTPVEDGSHK